MPVKRIIERISGLNPGNDWEHNVTLNEHDGQTKNEFGRINEKMDEIRKKDDMIWKKMEELNEKMDKLMKKNKL